jgi:hypothetical protein
MVHIKKIECGDKHENNENKIILDELRQIPELKDMSEEELEAMGGAINELARILMSHPSVTGLKAGIC